MEVVKHGNTFKHLKCNECECEFNYCNKDVDIQVYSHMKKPHRIHSVVCPECGRRIEISKEYIEK